MVIILLVLLLAETLREKYTLPDTGWLAIGAFLLSLLFVPVLIVQSVLLFSHRNAKSIKAFVIEAVIWLLTSGFYFFVLE